MEKRSCLVDLLSYVKNSTLVKRESKTTLTELGLYLGKRSINKSEVSKKTGISKTRMSRLTTQPNAYLRASELYLIALAIDVDPSEMFLELTKGLKLKV